MRPSSPFPQFKRYGGAGRCSLEAVREDLAETGQGSTSLAVKEKPKCGNQVGLLFKQTIAKSSSTVLSWF